ncbi:hypothetical protein KO516_17060 [Citreicella sp. C3M06]|uniref:hypothetical protein n=1 Tax=Citreicella sp. C3M06 TaxID=2841564 RepID=UPI001C081CB5|nr:hypothetical protein [Citreicella sp. C3M06]MBU2962499.1 hypothetical protein [Citreicella sp. C3M06]
MTLASVAVLKPFDDFHRLIATRADYQCSVRVVSEATGIPLACYLGRAGFEVDLVSSAASLPGIRDKSDPNDMQVILPLMAIGIASFDHHLLLFAANEFSELAKPRDMVAHPKSGLWHRVSIARRGGFTGMREGRGFAAKPVGASAAFAVMGSLSSLNAICCRILIAGTGPITPLIIPCSSR